MIYDVRFETGDVIHRFFKFLQLLILGMNSDKTPSDRSWIRSVCRKI